MPVVGKQMRIKDHGEGQPGHKKDPISKISKQKRLETWLKWQIASLASIKS
jgi:hypothetical protein